MKKQVFRATVCAALLGWATTLQAQLYSSGNNYIPGNRVGIGTSTPQKDFSVAGSASFTGNGIDDGVFIANPYAEQGISLMRSGFSARADLRFDGSSLRLLADNGSGPPAANSGITINTFGYVGVNQSSPLYPLDVFGPVRFTGLLSGTNTSFLTLNSNSELEVMSISNVGNVNGVGVANYIPKWTGPNDLAGTSLIYDDGNSIGIGTNVLFPTQRVRVTGASSIEDGVFAILSGAGPRGYGMRAYVSDRDMNFGGYFTSHAGIESTGGYFEGLGNTFTNISTGVRALATSGDGTMNSYGVYAEGLGEHDGYGIYAEGRADDNAFGARILATDAQINYGVYAEAVASNVATLGNQGILTWAHSNTGSAYNYGLYAIAPTGANNYAGYFDGNVFRTGNDNFTSDARFKTGVQELSGALDRVMQLRPSTYEFKKDQIFNFPEGEQFGFIAQEMEAVFPELVKDNATEVVYKDGKAIPQHEEFKSVNYVSLIPVLTAALQEQQILIDALTAEVSELKGTDGAVTRAAAGESVGYRMNDLEEAVLYQNSPNPFDLETVIRYSVPEAAGEAVILVFDMQGKQLRSYNLRQKGSSSIRIASAELDPGMYIYTLLVDGKEVDSKRMILMNR